MALELPGVTRIDTAAEARSHARRWHRMARELDTPDAPDVATSKRDELRQRAKAAEAWARQQEDALLRAQQEHDATLEREHARESNVVPMRQGEAPPARRAPSSRARGAARRAGNAAYHRARPPAMRLVHRGRQHFFQGATEPFAAAGGGWDLLFEGLGLSLAVVLIADLLRSPRAIEETSSRALSFLGRAVNVVDPITGVANAAYPVRRPATGPPLFPGAIPGAGGRLTPPGRGASAAAPLPATTTIA